MTKIAFSPCPNDTFLFGPWVKGWVAADVPVKAELMDIDALNVALRRRQFPLQKVSAVTAFQNLDAYEILPVGGTLGFGVGPVVVGRRHFDLKDLAGKKVALPGEGTTAHFLFQLFGPSDIDAQFVRYDKIIPMVQKGEVDAGVLIHEGRFVLEREKMKLIADLGALWEDQEELPLPLGVIAVERFHKEKDAFIGAILSSLSYARQHLQELYPYILENSIEKDPEIVEKHISLYVTQETAGFTSLGEKALQRFFERGLAIGSFSALPV
jgi:1,4-dihydroxy-6-naphthoate synthase